MSVEQRDLGTIQYQGGLMIPVQIPRNVSFESFQILGGPASNLGAGAYIPSTAIQSVQLGYKGATFYDRNGQDIKELDAIEHKVAPAAELWLVKPETGMVGSDNNFLYVRCNPLTITNPTGTSLTYPMHIIGNVLNYNKGSRIQDFAGYVNYAATAGVSQFNIPPADRTIKFLFLRYADGGVLADPVAGAQLSLYNTLTGQFLFKDVTWAELALNSQTFFGYAHAAGLLEIPINKRQNAKEGWQLIFNLLGAGAAVTLDILCVTQF
jgi:hypothetical protein